MPIVSAESLRGTDLPTTPMSSSTTGCKQAWRHKAAKPCQGSALERLQYHRATGGK
jgi:hypothetical protein